MSVHAFTRLVLLACGITVIACLDATLINAIPAHQPAPTGGTPTAVTCR